MKKYLTNILSSVLVLSSIFVLSGLLFSKIVYSQDPGSANTIEPGTTNTVNSDGSITLNNPFNGSDSLFALLTSIMENIVLPIGGILAVLAFIYSGFLYVTAQGNEEQLKTAHKALLYTSIGTAILLGSWVLARVICETIVQIGGPACVT